MRYILLFALLVTSCTGKTLPQTYRPMATSNYSYYVRTDGSDAACTGLVDAAYTSGSYPQACAYATWQAAANTVDGLDFNNHWITIKAGEQGVSETFTGGGIDLRGLVGGGRLYLEPSSSGTTIIATAGNDAVGAEQSTVQVWVGGLTLQALGGGYGTIEITSASLFFDTAGPTFGSSGSRSADIWLHENLSLLQVTNSSFTIAGNQKEFIEVSDNAHAFIESNTITLSGTPAWSAAYAVVTANGSLQYTNNTYVGTATGVKYSVTLNGVLNTEGGGASHLPGSIAGSTSTGGVVDTL